MSVEAVEGLRERKRRLTKQTIAREALELFARQGYAETTIAQVAEASEVSPRTVSAYFPHKEDLAFPDTEEAFARLEEQLKSRPPGQTAADTLRTWLASWLAQVPHDDQHAMRRRVIDEDETLRAYEQRHLARAQEILAEAMADDLGVSPDALEPQMAAAATVTVFTKIGEHIKGHEEDEASRAAALALVDRALVFISGGIGALRESQ